MHKDYTMKYTIKAEILYYLQVSEKRMEIFLNGETRVKIVLWDLIIPHPDVQATAFFNVQTVFLNELL